MIWPGLRVTGTGPGRRRAAIAAPPRHPAAAARATSSTRLGRFRRVSRAAAETAGSRRRPAAATGIAAVSGTPIIRRTGWEPATSGRRIARFECTRSTGARSRPARTERETEPRADPRSRARARAGTLVGRRRAWVLVPVDTLPGTTGRVDTGGAELGSSCARTGSGEWEVPPLGGGAGATGAGSTAGSRGGSSVSGSMYPCCSAVRRTPRWRYGWGCSASPLGPIVPTTSPSATAVPTRTPIDPSWTRVTEKPSAVRIVSESPEPGTSPAKPTLPAAGARTSDLAGAAMSMPRCWPLA
jgi:hypothetical protein